MRQNIEISAQNILFQALMGIGILLPLIWTDSSFASSRLQEQEMLQVKVECYRPLEEAVIFLARKHRWQVTYEDPSFYPPEEITEIIQLSKDLHLYTPENPPTRRLAPKKGSLLMDYSLMSKSGDPMKAEEIIQQLIDIYARGNSLFTFYLVRNGDWLHVVPQPVKMAGGDFSPPLLDTHISITGAERSLGETLQLITEALAQKTGEKVGVGISPHRFLRQSRVGTDFIVRNEPARMALARLLARFETKLCWHLLYSPGSMHALNLLPVPPLPSPIIVPEQ